MFLIIFARDSKKNKTKNGPNSPRMGIILALSPPNLDIMSPKVKKLRMYCLSTKFMFKFRTMFVLLNVVYFGVL